MIVDTSALVAIVRAEPDADRYAAALSSSPRNQVSAANYLEAAIVVDSVRDPVASCRLRRAARGRRHHARRGDTGTGRGGRTAYRDFGKGSGRPARLNFGDCFAYALAVTTAELAPVVPRHDTDLVNRRVLRLG